MTRTRQSAVLTLAVTTALAASAGAASQPKPTSGSTTMSGAYGVSLLKPPSSIPCSALQKSQGGNGRYNVVLGAKYGSKSSQAGSVEAVLISGPGTTTPTYLKRPSNTSGWRYGNMPVSKCGGQKYTVRYLVTKKNDESADKRFSVSFTITGS